MTSSNVMHKTGHSKLVQWDNPEGWDGEGDGRGLWDGETRVHLWRILVSVRQKPPLCCQVISLQLK